MIGILNLEDIKKINKIIEQIIECSLDELGGNE